MAFESMNQVVIKDLIKSSILKVKQASTLTQNVPGPVGPVTPRTYWSCKILTGPTFFSLTITRKNIA